ncbi:MAG: amidohydrolase family protein [Methylobacteriaceae bacterium]|nr:amidohydrolase family protein [Methylobacteriaceae bacterium]
MVRTLIRNATIISVDPDVGDLRRGDILIDGSKIAAIAPSIEADDAEIIEAANRIAIPGFIDTHRHTWESLLRATGPDWSLAQYFTGVRVVMGGLYTPEDNYVANLLGALDALDGGITTLYDWSHNNNSPEHADASVQGLKDAGMRGVFGYGNANAEWFPPNTIATNYDDIRRVRKQHLPSDDGLVTMAVASRGPQFTTLDITEKDFLTARDLGIRITVHVGDGLWGLNRPLVQLDSRGLLKDDTTYVHCNTIGDDEFKLIGATGGTGSIAPEVEMQMGHGLPPALRFLSAGVRPSLSIDVVTTVPSDMFNAMRALLAGTRLMVHRRALEERTAVDPLPLTSRDVLEFATLQGAKACGLDHKTGSLTPGKQADIVLINTDSMNLIPMNNPVGAVVEFANVGNVEAIFVAGKARKRNGKLLDLDFPAFRRRVDAHRDALFARAGVPTDGSWVVTPYEEEPKSEF